MMLTSSVIVTRARGLEPDGIPATKDGLCAYCGHEIKAGDPCLPFSAGSAFMDDLSLAARGSNMTCGYCVHNLSAEGLRSTGYGVFSEESGVLPFRKWGDVASALLSPPGAPFVMLYATANNQHMAWRAPVNYSRDLFYVRVGLRDLKIRRHKLTEAIEVCKRVAVAMGRNADPKGKTLPNPFGGLSPDLKDPWHGDLSAAFSARNQALIEPFDLAFLADLTLGETWALRFVLTPNAGASSEE